MVAVSGGLVFLGYQLLVYGWSEVNHGNAGFFDILWPGRYKGNPLDVASLAGGVEPGTSTLVNPTPTIKQLPPSQQPSGSGL